MEKAVVMMDERPQSKPASVQVQYVLYTTRFHGCPHVINWQSQESVSLLPKEAKIPRLGTLSIKESRGTIFVKDLPIFVDAIAVQSIHIEAALG